MRMIWYVNMNKKKMKMEGKGGIGIWEDEIKIPMWWRGGNSEKSEKCAKGFGHVLVESSFYLINFQIHTNCQTKRKNKIHSCILNIAHVVESCSCGIVLMGRRRIRCKRGATRQSHWSVTIWNILTVLTYYRQCILSF